MSSLIGGGKEGSGKGKTSRENISEREGGEKCKCHYSSRMPGDKTSTTCHGIIDCVGKAAAAFPGTKWRICRLAKTNAHMNGNVVTIIKHHKKSGKAIVKVGSEKFKIQYNHLEAVESEKQSAKTCCHSHCGGGAKEGVRFSLGLTPEEIMSKAFKSSQHGSILAEPPASWKDVPGIAVDMCNNLRARGEPISWLQGLGFFPNKVGKPVAQGDIVELDGHVFACGEGGVFQAADVLIPTRSPSMDPTTARLLNDARQQESRSLVAGMMLMFFIGTKREELSPQDMIYAHVQENFGGSIVVVSGVKVLVAPWCLPFVNPWWGASSDPRKKGTNVMLTDGRFGVSMGMDDDDVIVGFAGHQENIKPHNLTPTIQPLHPQNGDNMPMHIGLKVEFKVVDTQRRTKDTGTTDPGKIWALVDLSAGQFTGDSKSVFVQWFEANERLTDRHIKHPLVMCSTQYEMGSETIMLRCKDIMADYAFRSGSTAEEIEEQLFDALALCAEHSEESQESLRDFKKAWGVFGGGE